MIHWTEFRANVKGGEEHCGLSFAASHPSLERSEGWGTHLVGWSKDGPPAVYVDGDITTNGIESAFSLLKRGIIGSRHKVSAKHLSAYLDEMTFRFNNRDNPYLFRDTLMKLIESPVLEYKKLTAA